MKRALISSLISVLFLSACASDVARYEASSLTQGGDTQQALLLLKDKVAAYPDDVRLRTQYESTLHSYLDRLVAEGDAALRVNDYATATARFQQVLSWQPENYRAGEGLRLIENVQKRDSMLHFARDNKESRPDEALYLAKQVLEIEPANRDALRIIDDIENRKARETNLKPALAAALKSPISLQFRDQPLMSVFDIIARIGKVNFIFDRDVPPNLKTTIFARDTTVEDVINLLLATNQLDKKILSDNTIMIYPKRPDKDRDYRDLVMKTFYLNNADPKQVLAMIKQMVKTRDVYIDERLNMLVMRDTAEAISVAERLIAAQDLPQPEVVFDVEVLEVSGVDLLNLGIQYPKAVTATFNTTLDGKTAADMTLAQLSSINKGNVLVNLGSPSVTANILRQRSDGAILANPKIRVKNKDKAKVVIGDRLPVITSVNSNGIVTENVNYQDVGLTLNVEPSITNQGDIGVKVTLEVSNLLDTQTTAGGGTVYRIGTRRAETNMSVRDGETQVLAGLLQRSNAIGKSGLPGLSELPVFDRIFGTRQDETKNTEVIMLFTPRIVRNLSIPGRYVTEFDSGTESSISTQGLRLRNASTVNLNNTGTLAPVPYTAPPTYVPPTPAPAAPAPAPQAQDGNAQQAQPAEPARGGTGRR
ncbi:secretin N-terminal domain-containing protein [Chitinibacteraceae bacterium HSL-7]